MKRIFVIVLVLAIAGVTTGMFWCFTHKVPQKQEGRGTEIESADKFNLSSYHNSIFGIDFKYPKGVFVCESKFENEKLRLDIYLGESCELAARAKDVAEIRLIVLDNTGYKTPEEAFNREFQDVHVNAVEIKAGKIKGYGGETTVKMQDAWDTHSNGYGAIFLKNNNIIKVSDSYYDVIINGKSSGNKLLMGSILASLAL